MLGLVVIVLVLLLLAAAAAAAAAASGPPMTFVSRRLQEPCDKLKAELVSANQEGEQSAKKLSEQKAALENALSDSEQKIKGFLDTHGTKEGGEKQE